MYNIIKIVELNGQRCGFMLRDINTGKDNYKSEEEARRLCDIGQVLNVRYTGKQFRKRQGKMSDFKVINYYDVFPKEKKTVSKKNITDDCKITGKYSWRTGKALQKYVNHALNGIKNERDFVKNIVRYCKNFNEYRGKVYAISGLRDTGKSIGMLQCIKKLDNYDRSVYIQLTRGKDIDFDELVDILNSIPEKIRLIFIDEISVVKDFVHCSGTLADNYTLDGKRVVIAGTDSYSIECAFSDGLFHRCILNNVTFISYQEYLRTVEKGSLKDYLESGGLYTASKYKGVDGLRSYVDTSIVGNIFSTITKNDLPEFKGISRQSIRSAIYMILYTIIYSNSKKASFDWIISNSMTDKVIEDRETIKRLVSNVIDVQQENIPRNTIRKVLKALEYMGVVVKCENISLTRGRNTTKYYVVSPYLVNNIYSLIVDIMISIGGSIVGRNKFSQIQGFVLESILVTHAIKYSGYDCYFYHNNRVNSEIDLILLDRNQKGIEEDDCLEGIRSNAYLAEIKLTANVGIALQRGHWVKEVSESDFSEDVDIVSRKIVYTGENDRENGLVNAREFLNKIGDLRSVLQ